MEDKNLLFEISEALKDDEKLLELKKDFEYNVAFSKWAYYLAKNNHKKVAQKLFDYALRSAKDFRDYKDYAFYISKKDSLHDLKLAKEAYYLASMKITLIRDLRNLADSLCVDDDSFYDKEMAKELYKKIVEKSTNAYEHFCTAESLCDFLKDKDFAREVYEKAVQLAQGDDELEYIADSIAQEDKLADIKWADKIYSNL